MRYWDSSALVPVLIAEMATGRLQSRLRDDPHIATWWGTELECISAIARREREHQLTVPEVEDALHRLQDFRSAWQEVQPRAALRDGARRFLRSHPLHAADALQLTAALVAANQQPASLEFVCLDDRLADAARREGFPVLS